MPTAITPIATYTTVGAVNTVVFSSIPGTYRDLMIVVRGTLTTANSVIGIRSGTTNIWRQSVSSQGGGSSPLPSTAVEATVYGQLVVSPTIFAFEAHIYDYAQTNKFKPITIYDAGSTSQATVTVGFWESTAAIAQVTVISKGGSTIAAGTKIDVYGVSS